MSRIDDLRQMENLKSNKFTKQALVDGKTYHNGDDPMYVGCPVCTTYVWIPKLLCRCSEPYYWTAKRDTTGKIGLDCNNCGRGFTDWTCPDCRENHRVDATYGSVKTGGCFVATAAFGDYASPEVVYLSQFRDDVLLSSRFGRSFVRAYYCIGPYFANVIESSSLLCSIVRKVLLKPIIWTLRLFF